MLSASQLNTLRRLLDRLIPKDQDPSACEAGVDLFVADLLSGDAKELAELIKAGLDTLEAGSFSGMSERDQDALLETFDPVFMARITELCAQGYYGRPPR